MLLSCQVSYLNWQQSILGSFCVLLCCFRLPAICHKFKFIAVYPFFISIEKDIAKGGVAVTGALKILALPRLA